MATTEVTVGLHVPDHGLDCRATSEFALDVTEHAALLTGDEDATLVDGVVAAIVLVDSTMVCKRHADGRQGLRFRLAAFERRPPRTWHGRSWPASETQHKGRHRVLSLPVRVM
jgi:hypothetical protein